MIGVETDQTDGGSEENFPLIPLTGIGAKGETIYVQRSPGGGLMYVSDAIGDGYCVVDFTVTNLDVLEYICSIHPTMNVIYDEIAMMVKEMENENNT